MINGQRGVYPDFGEVPGELWSAYLEAPFEECSVCGRPLKEARSYGIQKVSNQRETIFEIAFCLNCGLALERDYSEQSAAALEKFMTDRLDLSRSGEQCSLCGGKLAGARTRSVCGLCSGRVLVCPVIRICGGCEEAMQELLSEKTRRTHEDFVNRVVPGVPAEFDIAPTLIL